MKILDNFMQLGSQVSTGVYLMGANVDGADTLVKSATASQGGDPEGVIFPVRVQNADDASIFQVMKASYTLDGADHKLELSEVITSSSGTSTIAFSTDADSLRFYGVTVNDVTNGLTSIGESGSYVSTTSTTYVTGGDDIVVTPVSDSVDLFVTASILTSFSAPTGTYATGSLKLVYINSSSTEIDIDSKYVGVRPGAYAALEVDADASFLFKLTQSNLDSSGDWRIRLKQKSVLTSVTSLPESFKTLNQQVPI